MLFVRFFILHPIGTILIAIALFLSGILGYSQLPVSALPKLDFPVIMVLANEPGGSPTQIATTIAAPLERHLGNIADIREMTSESTMNQARILLQFNLSRKPTGAARDVEAALRASRQDLPSSLRTNPSYIEANTNGMPIMVLTITSITHTPQQIYDYASNIITPALSQISGVGNVDLRGSALPAVRIEINPLRLFRYGIGFEDIRAALTSANAHTPKGYITFKKKRYMLLTNDQSTKALDYKGLVIAYRNNQPVMLSDVASIIDGAEDLRQAGYLNGYPDIMITIYPKSDANIIETTNLIKKHLPTLEGMLPGGSKLTVELDRSLTIRASLSDTQYTLILSVFLVIFVVIIFLRNFKSTLIPAIVVPLSIMTSFGIMHLLGYQLDTLSLMALTIATGFVVDDAIVVLENILRFIEHGYTPKNAATTGAGEVTFTVFSITISLIVVFLPILFMEGIAGMFFHEFAMTLIIALSVSLILSLTLTPTLCALMLSHNENTTILYRFPRINHYVQSLSSSLETLQNKIDSLYAESLKYALNYKKTLILSIPITLIIAGLLFHILPKELFPQQDDGVLMGRIIADPDISFHALQKLTQKIEKEIAHNPDIKSIVGGLGKKSSNSVNIFITLKSETIRKKTASEIVADINTHYRNKAGVKVIVRLPTMIGGGARSSDSLYQYTLQSSDADTLATWTPRVVQFFSHLPMLRDVSSDMEANGRNITLNLNRDLEARYNITPQLISNILFDAFSQRTASVIYTPLNQYRVIMEASPTFWQNTNFLEQMWISQAGGTPGGGTASNNLRVKKNDATTILSESALSYKNAMANALAGGKTASNGAAVTTTTETMVPLPLITKIISDSAPLSINHQGQFVATTISFNLAENAALGDAIATIEQNLPKLHLPSTIQGDFSGNAADYKKTSGHELLLIIAAVATVYIVLGILYESLIHPLTIISTLPSAGVGALLAVYLTNSKFSLMTFIGLILLIGIVKKNAIMLVDFAITEEKKGKPSREAIYQASLLRFRPILMTTFSAALGALPLLLSHGYGSEMRRPLGLAILGGLSLCQLLTLYTTPAIYLSLDQLKSWLIKKIIKREKK